MIFEGWAFVLMVAGDWDFGENGHCLRQHVPAPVDRYKIFCSPYGTWFLFYGAYPGLTSGATICRPYGAENGQESTSELPQFGSAPGEQVPGFAVPFVAVAGLLCGREDWA